MLERRLDNVLYLAGFATSRSNSRQLIGHGHVNVNGRRVDVASYLVTQDDVIAIRESEARKTVVKGNIETTSEREIPAWLQVSEESLTITVRTLPGRDEISVETREQMVVEVLGK